ncbi:methylenetetrahydrofolate reductase [Mesorhizobium sp. CAU 1741]|uniref:methylenetetrahydrofolate reductase n=1 Tax=Mesorhizobium sp. CAU 1741 TaxID=3140366 RepID=UPI00325A9741
MLNLLKGRTETVATDDRLIADFLSGFSIEVMPRTAAKVEDFRALLPQGTRVYVAHIEGTPIEEMVATAKRLRDEGFAPMPHIPARIIKDAAELEEWLVRYTQEAGVDQALLLAGGVTQPYGAFDSSMKMMETGLFQKHGLKRLHVGGHPEGNKDIDADGSSAIADAALAWKQAFAQETGVEMAIVTQFAFAAKPIVDWAERLRNAGISLPIHVGIAGPAKLQTLIKYAISCGVGPSLKVLQKRAMDLTKLMLPYEPNDVVAELAAWQAEHPEGLIKQVHFFPLGGIKTNAEWVNGRLDAVK